MPWMTGPRGQQSAKLVGVKAAVAAWIAAILLPRCTKTAASVRSRSGKIKQAGLYRSASMMVDVDEFSR
ncbi:MAG: hypothetical protein JNN30_22085 [Rhodanobacteraceae bacterium]|nr:hypothetical protein [Rhodanobacteraceae bacterium]